MRREEREQRERDLYDERRSAPGDPLGEAVSESLLALRRLIDVLDEDAQRRWLRVSQSLGTLGFLQARMGLMQDARISFQVSAYFWEGWGTAQAVRKVCAENSGSLRLGERWPLGKPTLFQRGLPLSLQQEWNAEVVRCDWCNVRVRLFIEEYGRDYNPGQTRRYLLIDGAARVGCPHIALAFLFEEEKGAPYEQAAFSVGYRPRISRTSSTV